MSSPLATAVALFAPRVHKHEHEHLQSHHKRHKIGHPSTALSIRSAIRFDGTRTPPYPTAREHAGQLPHAVSSVSAFLGVALAPQWTTPRACEHGHLAMLPRLASREPADMNEHYRAHLFSKELMSASQRGNLPIVQWLCCEYCPSGFAWKGMEAAAVASQLSVLQWLVARYDYFEEWLPRLVVQAASHGRVQVLRWLAEQPERLQLSETLWDAAAEFFGAPDIVWLLQACMEVHPDMPMPERLLGPSIEYGNLKCVQCLHAAGISITMPDDLEAAVTSGSIEMLQWVVERCEPSDDMHDLFELAAERGDTRMLAWLDTHWHGASSAAPIDIDRTADSGHLEAIEWLHAHRSIACTSAAMDNAAASGHFEVVQWLHKHRTEALAAAHGRLEVLQWLHANGLEGFDAETMDAAASGGHLEVIEWLHVHRTEGCTDAAMDLAARDGHLGVVKWLHVHDHIFRIMTKCSSQ